MSDLERDVAIALELGNEVMRKLFEMIAPVEYLSDAYNVVIEVRAVLEAELDAMRQIMQLGEEESGEET